MSRSFESSAYHVDPDVARAETLPASAFTDPDFLEREQETIFARSWLLLPPLAEGASLDRSDSASLSEQLREPESHAPASLAGRPVLLRRDTAGVLHAFPNVCTHAWHTLVQTPGRGRVVTCPQHGRVFDGAGRCVAQRGFSPELVPGFPRGCDHLQELPCGSWGPLLFAAAEPPARSLDQFLEPVRASIGQLPLDRLQPQRHTEEVREVDGNWKLHAWNFMDTFHIPYIHHAPEGLADAIELASYRTELFDRASLQWAYARDPENGFDPEVLPARFRDPARPGRRVFALWWFLFPNVTLNFYPWGLSVNVYEPVAGKPDRTRFVWQHLVLDRSKYAEREKRWLLAKVDGEDVRALAEVRRGAASGFAPRGRFAPEAEAGPHWLHRLVSLGVSEHHPRR